LPVTISESATRLAEAAAAARSCVERRILVVDDLPDNAASLTVLLRRLGHRVETAFSGLDALALAAQFRPQIMLLDIGMPDLDGFEVCRRVRKQDWGKGIFVVALSGWGQESDRRNASEAGFNAHLVKPLDFALLESLLVDLDAKLVDLQAN
jgi:CheY-like chemotaxis protein